MPAGAIDSTADGDPEPMIRMFERLVDKRRARLLDQRIAAQ